MKRLISGRRTPALVVALGALVVATAGSALGAGYSTVAHQAKKSDSVASLSFTARPHSSTVKLLNVDGLTIKTSCSSAGEAVIRATTSSTNADLIGHVIDSKGVGHAIADDAFHRGVTDDLTATVGGDQDASGNAVYETAAGKVVSLTYAFDNSSTLNGKNVCTVYGTAISN